MHKRPLNHSIELFKHPNGLYFPNTNSNKEYKQEMSDAMERFLNAMNEKEKEAYEAKEHLPHDKLEEAMQDVLRVNIYRLFEAALQEKTYNPRSTQTLRPQRWNAPATPPPPGLGYGSGYGAAKQDRGSGFNMNSLGKSLPGARIDIKVTINAPVTQLLNANDKALSREIKQKFNVDVNFGVHFNLDNCTFALFNGSGKELAISQDRMWEFLQPHQQCRVILVNQHVKDLWMNWPDAQKTLFRNRTNVNIGTTDCNDEIVLRAFHMDHIEKVKPILLEYARFGMLPKNDKQLLKRMWGTK